MLTRAVMGLTGFDEITSQFVVGAILFLVGSLLLFATAEWLDLRLKEAKHRAKATRRGGLQGVPPADQYIVPYSGHPECGGKFCELRGCAVLGSCRARFR